MHYNYYENDTKTALVSLHMQIHQTAKLTFPCMSTPAVVPQLFKIPVYVYVFFHRAQRIQHQILQNGRVALHK